jgi:hypothetical protein
MLMWYSLFDVQDAATWQYNSHMAVTCTCTWEFMFAAVAHATAPITRSMQQVYASATDAHMHTSDGWVLLVVLVH